MTVNTKDSGFKKHNKPLNSIMCPYLLLAIICLFLSPLGLFDFTNSDPNISLPIFFSNFQWSKWLSISPILYPDSLFVLCVCIWRNHLLSTTYTIDVHIYIARFVQGCKKWVCLCCLCLKSAQTCEQGLKFNILQPVI